MITARAINAWRAQAPWSSDVKVEQDYLLCRALEAIFEDRFLASQVAMRGGTVLHKGHLAPATRYSEDIDLVLVGERPARHIKLALTRVLKPLLGTPAESIYTTINLAVRNVFAKSTIIRNTYVYDPSSIEATFAKLKIEVNTNETQSLYPLVSVPVLVPDGADGVRELMVRSYDLDEMLGTKMRALLQRDHGRDLFDLWRAWEHSTSSAEGAVDPARVGKAFRFTSSARAAVSLGPASCRRMASRKFLRDLEGDLRARNRNTTHGTRTTSSCEVFRLTWMPLRNRSGAAPLRWWQTRRSASSIPGIKVDRNRNRRSGESNP